MKRSIKWIALFFSCFALTACANESVSGNGAAAILEKETAGECITDFSMNEESGAVEKSLDEYTDCTAVIKNSIHIPSDAKFSTVGSAACLGKIYKNVAELYPAARNIVAGEVVGITYTDTNASARTYYSLAVTEVLKGEDIEEESIVTILELQGYCRLSQFVEKYGTAHFEDYDAQAADSSYFVYTLSGEPLVEIGDRYVLFLGEACKDENASGYYVVQEAFIGKYQLNDAGFYERYSPEDVYYQVVDEKTGVVTKEAPMTLNEVREAIHVAALKDLE